MAATEQHGWSRNEFMAFTSNSSLTKVPRTHKEECIVSALNVTDKTGYPTGRRIQLVENHLALAVKRPSKTHMMCVTVPGFKWVLPTPASC